MDSQVQGTEIEQQIRVLSLVDPLLRALGTRVLAFISLGMAFGLFCWAMWLQRGLAFAVAGAFVLGVLWPVLFITWKGSAHE